MKLYKSYESSTALNLLEQVYQPFLGTPGSDETPLGFLRIEKNSFFDGLTILNVVETQDFTLSDMFVYKGGIVALSLWMFFVSVGDVGY